MDINLLLLVLSIMTFSETTYLVYVNSKKNRIHSSDRMIFVDTSVLIDGRILTIAKAGFIGGRLCIPRSVVGELQYMADQSDSEKRSRARHGLDVINELKLIDGINFEIYQDGSKASEGVDERLLNLAKKHHGLICTIDYNLNKVARVEGITVLNVNDLSMGLRMSYLPGEKMSIELNQKGNDSHQAVGHLADGTMVVVENADKQIGKIVDIEFVRSLQTAAGKMMFARLITKPQHNNKQPQSIRKNNKPVHKSKFGRKSVGSTENDIVNLANK